MERGPFVKLLALYAIFSCTAFTLVYFVVKRFTLPAAGANGSYDIWQLRTTWNEYLTAHAWVVPFWVTSAIAATAVVFAALAWVQKKVSSEEQTLPLFTRIAQRNAIVLTCCLAAFVVYSVLFTTLGANPGGMKAGVIDYLLYWIGQQNHPRIPGPPDYFVLRLVLYEIASVVGAVAAFFVYTYLGLGAMTYYLAFLAACIGSAWVYWKVLLVKTWELFPTGIFVWLIFLIIALAILFSQRVIKAFAFVPEEEKDLQEQRRQANPLAPDGLRIFLIYWTIMSLLIYAMLNEKVPWLIVTQSLPLALLAGAFFGDFWEKYKHRGFTYVLVFPLGLLVLYQAQATLNLNFYRSDDPRELMVYVQTGHSIKGILQEIDGAAEILGSDYLPPNPKRPIAALQGEASWPYVWYLRNYMTHTIGEQFQAPPPANTPFVFVDQELADRVKLWSKGKYTKRIVKHRLWWPPPNASLLSFQNELPFWYFRQRNAPMSDAWRAFWRYLLYREIWNPNDPGLQPGYSGTLLYSKTPLLEPEAQPQVVPGYSDAPKPLMVQGMVGHSGTAEQEFNEPRGVALTPDGSQVYVLDARNGRVQVFNADLQYQGYFGGPGSGVGEFTTQGDRINGPNGGIAIGPDGTIFVTDTWAAGGGRINRYRPDGTALPPLVRTPPDSFFYPRGLAVAADGTLYVADTGNKVVVRFAPDGTYQGIALQDGFNEPVGMTVGPDDRIYICDVGNQRVASYSRQGQMVKSWTVMGWNPDSEAGVPWIEPYVAVDPQGNVYISDSTNNTIHCFDPLGSRVYLGGGEGTAPGYLRGPKGIAVNAQGVLYIADSQNNRVVKAVLPR